MPRNTLNDFWLNIMHAFDCMPPLLVPDGPRLSAEDIEKDFHLSPHTAEGFVEKEFDFLQPDELSRLKSAVAGVRAVATELGGRLVATPEEKQRALPHFKTIVDILAPDRFMEPEAFEIGKQIEATLKTPWPAKLDHLRFMAGPDSTGDPALWVWAFVKEKESGEYDQDAFFAAVDEIAPALRSAAEDVLRKVDPERWPYISYRSMIEQFESEAAA